MADKIKTQIRQDVARVAARAAGLNTYIPAKPCRRGHSKRCVSSGHCVACRAIWYAANSERYRAAMRVWRTTNPEKYNAGIAAWRTAHPGRYETALKAWREAHPERREEDLSRLVIWNAAHPEAMQIRAKNYQMRKRKIDGSHSVADIEAIVASQKGRCAYCKKRLKKGFHIDHIKPISKGGSNGRRNLQATCGTCNIKKAATDPVKFARKLGLLI